MTQLLHISIVTNYNLFPIILLQGIEYMFEDIDKPVTLSLVSRGCEVIHVPRSRFQEMCSQQSLTHILLKCIKTYPGKVSINENLLIDDSRSRCNFLDRLLLSKIWKFSRIKNSLGIVGDRDIHQFLLKPSCENAQMSHVT